MHKAQIIDGKKIAAQILSSLHTEIALIKRTLGLAVIVVGHDPASQIYVNKKKQIATEIGINSTVIQFETEVTQKELEAKIHLLNADTNINGVLVQLPLPSHINAVEVINCINPLKDVDGFGIQNVGKLILGLEDGLYPCTPLGCLDLIKTVIPNLSGANACVIGRSNVVGRPMANLLLNENCTVTNIHLETKNPLDIAQRSDILVVATGHAGLVTNDWVNEHAVVIDVGINRISNKLYGDVKYDEVKNKVRAITPVPGGVGPMTVAYLMKNTLKAYKLQKNLNHKN